MESLRKAIVFLLREQLHLLLLKRASYVDTREQFKQDRGIAEGMDNGIRELDRKINEAEALLAGLKGEVRQPTERDS